MDKRIDYERMKKSNPKLKAMLTRAMSDKIRPDYYQRVKAACTAAVKEWDAVGAWPDGWNRWQIALDDAAIEQSRRRYYEPPIPRVKLEEL